MAENISKITVKIGGMNYQLLAAENEKYMRQVAERADEMIRRVMQNNPHLTLSMSTVLALVNAVDEQHNARNEMETAELRKAEAEKQLAEMKAELMRCREQTWEIKKELLQFQNLCKEYEDLLETETITDDENSGENLSQNFQQTPLDDYLNNISEASEAVNDE